MKHKEVEASFQKFGWIVLYHVSFFIFITTIGLNIIFGIIVDTFSELRDLKVRKGSTPRIRRQGKKNIAELLESSHVYYSKIHENITALYLNCSGLPNPT